MSEVVTLATAIVVLATAVMSWRTRQKVEQVHVLVNSRMAEMVARVNQLTTALDESGTRVPPAPDRGTES